MIIYGLLREEKQPPDRRVAFTPDQCADIKAKNKFVDILVQSSEHRIFTDEEYMNKGISVVENMTSCDILFGIKEVPAEKLIHHKTYLFFSHTIKKQSHNQAMFKAILNKKIKMVDYECLTWKNGARVLGFGRFAGLVGAYETLRAWGIRKSLFHTIPAYECKHYEEMKGILNSISRVFREGKYRLVVTGSGRVSSGVIEVMSALNLKKVSPEDFLNGDFTESVFCQLDIGHLYENKNGGAFDHDHFFKNHNQYQSLFAPYTKKTDILINGVYWDSELPRHFEAEDTRAKDFKIKLIGDISCDINGSVPITIRETESHSPVFGWNPQLQQECEPFLEHGIDVLAVPNLPSELPADASKAFGEDLQKYILPELIKPDSVMIKNATLCENGRLLENHAFLEDYAFD